MLTERAMYERKWGRFPELGKVLSGKQLTVKWTGPSSVSDNIFDQVVQLLKIYALVEDHGSDVDDALLARKHSMRKELSELARGLAWAAGRFAEASRQIEERSRRSIR